MDPSTALENLIDALAAGNVHAARESLDALVGWHDRGGFLPRWPADGEYPTGLGAFHLGRLVAAIDLGAEYSRGEAFGAARRGYAHALWAIDTLLNDTAPKPCVKCGEPIDDPQIVGPDERCEACSDYDGDDGDNYSDGPYPDRHAAAVRRASVAADWRCPHCRTPTVAGVDYHGTVTCGNGHESR